MVQRITVLLALILGADAQAGVGCVTCSAVTPTCVSASLTSTGITCTAGQRCSETARSCASCASAGCVIVQNFLPVATPPPVGTCITCPPTIPTCTGFTGCQAVGQTCVISQQTCFQCATQTCSGVVLPVNTRFPTGFVATTGIVQCVTCPTTSRCAPPYGSQAIGGLSCLSTQRCVETLATTCTQCGAATCTGNVAAPVISNCVTCPPLSRCSTTAGAFGGLVCAVNTQVCRETAATCTTCGTATCYNSPTFYTPPVITPSCVSCPALTRCGVAGGFVCAANQRCVATPSTCTYCGTATCQNYQNYVPVIPSTPACCTYANANCYSCQAGMTTAAWCLQNPGVVGCGGGGTVYTRPVNTDTRGNLRSEEEEDDELSDSAIAAIIIACVVFCLLCLLLLWFLFGRKKKQKPQQQYVMTSPPVVMSEPRTEIGSVPPVMEYGVGQPVSALFRDGVWYDAHVTSKAFDGTYEVRWYDGSISDMIPPDQLRPQ